MISEFSRSHTISTKHTDTHKKSILFQQHHFNTNNSCRQKNPLKFFFYSQNLSSDVSLSHAEIIWRKNAQAAPYRITAAADVNVFQSLKNFVP